MRLDFHKKTPLSFERGLPQDRLAYFFRFWRFEAFSGLILAAACAEALCT
jgi:hypothetical protein